LYSKEYGSVAHFSTKNYNTRCRGRWRHSCWAKRGLVKFRLELA